jgi:hypothetical protein
MLGACLALVYGTTISLPASLQDEPPSLRASCRDLPLSAVIADASLRLEKLTQSPRASLKKPERGLLLSKATHAAGRRPSRLTRRLSWNLPRRQQHPARARPISPDDPSDASLC